MSAFTKTLPVGVEPLVAGLHDNIPSARYHADELAATPSLSSGVTRTLVDETPADAYLEHVRLGGTKPDATAEMILGGFVHGILSNDLHEFIVGNFDNYTTKAAKEWRDAAAFAGRTPILEKNVDRAERIAKALRDKAAVGLTTDPFTAGKAEVTALWQEDGCWFRARYDRLILDPTFFGDVWDWKTTGVGVSADALERIIIDKGYHIQAAHYLRGLRALAPEFRGRLTFTLAFVETEAPYKVRRVPISEGFLSIGERLVDRAFRQWKECMAANNWPEGPSESLILTPPTWYLKKVEEAA